MKKIPVLILVLFIPLFSYSQVIFNSKIDSVKNLVSANNLRKYNRELSGDTMTNVNGVPVLIYSRYYQSPSNIIASNYIFEKFQSFGLQTRYQHNNSTNINVIAKKTGSKYPNKKILITAHYDNILNSGPGPLDTVHGADDNASGVCAVLEAARLLANFNSLYTIEFIAWDEEEIGLYGSRAYADSSYFHGDTIIAVLNFDMISWDGNNDGKITIMTDNNSNSIANVFIEAINLYQIPLVPSKSFGGGGSDHYYFWQRGYKAITGIEFTGDFHPYYHMLGDSWDKVNLPYFHNFSKAAIATLLTLASDNFIIFNHTPPVSSPDTSARYLTCEIKFPVKIATGLNAPRLYYRINSGPYTFVNAQSVSNDIYTFRIHGNPSGTLISYYFAAQDSAGNIISTYPSGGSGINPPGTTPPPQVLSYSVQSLNSFTSTTVPKTIFDLQQIKDTINIIQDGKVENVKVNLNINHPNVGELFITLYHNSSSSTLAQYNGSGGQNFTNTTFSDSANLSITQGVPPFTGYFKPISPLNVFNNQSMQCNWILRIYDKTSGNTGTLLSWSVILRYSPQVGIGYPVNELPGDFRLEQNYPNPFNPVTNIRFQVPLCHSCGSRNPFVTIKVFDFLGREVRTLLNEYKQPGTYQVSFDAGELSSGVYFYKMTAGEFSDVKKMILIR